MIADALCNNLYAIPKIMRIRDLYLPTQNFRTQILKMIEMSVDITAK